MVELVDRLAEGQSLGPPTSRATKAIFDNHVKSQGGSVRLAYAFLTAYSIIDLEWDFNSVPTGIRGKYGDKLLANELNLRHVTFHKNITAFGENLGWKGNVRQFQLSSDPRFSKFVLALQNLDPTEKTSLVNHIAWILHGSRVIPKALPRLPDRYLSYARCLELCDRLLNIPSEGHIPQFLVAAFLEIHRRRLGNRIVTHHPHASDKFDGTTGDIEEFREDSLVASYEVTVRDDWKNRLSDFGKKVSESGLHKYIIFAANVRKDSELFPASNLISFVERLPFDLAIVDLTDFFSVFCAELHREELEKVINRAYELLSEPRLSGREDFLSKYREVTNDWLDS